MPNIKKTLLAFLLVAMACGGIFYTNYYQGGNAQRAEATTQATSKATPKKDNPQEEKDTKQAAKTGFGIKEANAAEKKRILVAFYSRTGDNYAVGNITKGNTHIVADMIAKDLKADTFEIKTVKQYPLDYRECTREARRERETNARPAMATSVPNMSDYDVIFLGYPIWYSDMPMVVYNFMESYDFKGKTIIPFATAAGDNLTGKERNIPQHAKGTKVLAGLGIEGKRAQENPQSVEPEVKAWLKGLGFEVQ